MRVAGPQVRDFTCAGIALGLAALALWPAREGTSRGLSFSVAIAFALLAYLLRGVNVSGAICGAAIAFVFYRIGDWRLFTVLFMVFCLTSFATRVSAAKLRLPKNPRGGAQVLANLIVPTVLLLAIPWSYRFAIDSFWMSLAALAELATDTVSSEVGEAFGRPTYSILTLGKVEAGINGGISLWGTTAGMAAAATIAATASILSPFVYMPWLIAAAGVAGMLFDSLLGATLENRGYLNNDAVNLIGTASASALTWLLMMNAPRIVC